MSSLLRISERQLLAEQAANRFPWRRAIGLAGLAGALSVVSMHLTYSPGDATPVAGMDHLVGQIKVAGILSSVMVLTAWFFRTVLVKRLQYAVIISLLVHILVCLGLEFYSLNAPLDPDADLGENDIPERQMSLPEYGGMETMNVAQPEWERPTEVDIAENAQQQVDRQQTNVEANTELDQVEHQDLVQRADTPDRREQQQQMERAEQLEMQRQMLEAETNEPEQLDAPQVTTTEVEQPELESREMDRAEAQLDAQREREELERQQREQQISAANIRARRDAQPNEIEETLVEATERSAAEAIVADTAAESADIAETREASQLSADERRLDTARNARPNLPSRQHPSDSAPRTNSRLAASGSFAPSRSARADGPQFNSASAAGSASMQRSATRSGSSSSAADSSAQSVSVASASGSSRASLSASSAASGSSVARGGASMPTGSAMSGGTLGTGRPSRRGVGSLRAGQIGRRSSSQSMARLSGSSGGSYSGGGSGRRALGASGGAVGTTAAGVSVPGAASGGGSSGSVLAGGPSRAASNVGRGGGGLPAGSGRGGSGRGSLSAPSGSRGSGRALAASGSSTSGLTGRSGPSARLSGRTVGGAPASGRGGRRSAAAALPAGALAAEQSGKLVMAGPQASGMSGGSGGGSRSGGLSGPRMGSSRRRSAGLPGSRRGGSTSVGRRRAGLPSGLGGSRVARRGSGGGAPKLASAGEIAGLIKRSQPGLRPVKPDKVSPGFSMRKPEMRREAVQKLGGNDASEAAVERGLEWLAKHQHANGKWSIDELNCTDHEDCKEDGAYQADAAATGLALLAFLGAGHTHQDGEYQRVVDRGLKYLIDNQKKDGDLFANGSDYTWLYSHGMAAIALCEAYGMTKDENLKDAAQSSLDFIAASQHPTFGGWRYKPRFESDTSVSGWQLMALKSGEMSGLSVPQSTYNKIAMWLDKVEAENSPGTFAYHPSQGPTEAMTAEGLLMRQYLGAKRTNEKLIAGADYLKMRLPRLEARDAYYWYYATQVMFHMQGDHWAAWNANLRDMLTDAQSKDGPTRGSWSPVEPTKDKWGPSGGRHYLTCLNLLMLEVYYRHLPLYIDLDR